MKERIAKAKKFIEDHPYELLAATALVGWAAALVMYNDEKRTSNLYHNQLCDISEAARLGYTMSYNAETEMIHLSAPKG